MSAFLTCSCQPSVVPCAMDSMDPTNSMNSMNSTSSMSSNDRHIDYVELPAGDVAASKRFYASVFGWTYQDWGDDYADTKSSGVSSGLTAVGPQAPKTPLVVIFVTDLAAAKSRVQAAGGIICRDIFDFPGGQRFHFVDPAGNELAVWAKP